MSRGSVQIHSVTMASTFTTGQQTVTTAGTAEALASSATVNTGVLIKALPGNGSAIVYIGTSTVDSTNGVALSSGDSWYVEVDDISKVYVDSDTDGAGVSFQYS